MTWTTQKPTTPGWYWYKEKYYACIVEVGPRQQLREFYDGMWVWFTSGRQSKLPDLLGQWSSETNP